MNLSKEFKKRVKTFESLKGHTSFKVGGRARYWYEPKDTGELIDFLKGLRSRFCVFPIGSGSNLLIKDGTVNRVFISLASAGFKQKISDGVFIKIGSGVRVAELISFLRKKDLGGYEFLAGIPGTLGGAVYMNAGAKDSSGVHREIKDILYEIEVLDRCGRQRIFKRKEISFSYRHSGLADYIITSVTLKLKKKRRGCVGKNIIRILDARKKAQEYGYPSAGSFFKNPPKGPSAGQLIDRCGLKGFKVGGAQVSTKHANFIVNTGQAKSSDVLKLMEIIRKKVYNQFKIKLIPEVTIVS